LSADPPLNIPPTTIFEDKHYLFERVPMRQDQAHLMSASNHDIVIHNDKGQNLIDSIDDPITFESTFQTLINAQHIFLVLGIPSEESQTPTMPQAEPISASEPDDFGIQADRWAARQGDSSMEQGLPRAMTSWTRREYQHFIRGLFMALDKTPGRNLAVCMTKS